MSSGPGESESRPPVPLPARYRYDEDTIDEYERDEREAELLERRALEDG